MRIMQVVARPASGHGVSRRVGLALEQRDQALKARCSPGGGYAEVMIPVTAMNSTSMLHDCEMNFP